VQDQGSTDEVRPGRRIAVIRHGKAEHAGRTDFERELADRGRKDSADAGAWLAREGFIADHALVSAAHRAVGTWRYVAEGADWELEPTLSQGLYSAGPETALDLVRESPAAAAAVVVVGHNPTMAYLASLLDDGDGDPEVASAMLAGYPTSAVAVFEYDGEWVDLDEGGARLVGFHVGRG
jgi:phosphohistidine phosphatase